MSVRAYRIIKIDTDKDPSFNCWHDQELLDIANTDQYDGNGGIITIEQSDAEELLAKLESQDKVDESLIEDVKQVIADCQKDTNDGIAEYLCY